MSYLPPHHGRIGFCRFVAITLLASALQVGAARAVEIDGGALFDSDRVVDIRIEVAEADWDLLRRQRRDASAFFSGAPIDNPYSYVRATVWINDVKIESVGLRKKGLFGSSDERRPSLKIKFDEYVDQDPVKGISRLTLNNNKQDATQISQYLTYKLFREAGVRAPRASFAHVTVNDQDLGVYTHVESIRKPFLTHSFGNKTGALYEGTLTDFYPKTVDKIEVKSNDKEGKRVVPARLADLLAQEGDLSLEELEKVIDVDNFMRYWVLEGIVRFWDGYASNQNNYYFYVNPDNGLGYFIPWGADASFNNNNKFGGFGSRSGTAIYAQSMLTNRLYAVEGTPERYRQTMLGLLDQVWIEDDILADIDRVEKLLQPHLSAQQRNADRAMKALRGFIRTRREVLDEELKAWPATVPFQPRKPMYTVEIGTIKGGFQTTWTDRRGGEESQSVVKDLRVVLDGASMVLGDFRVTAHEYRAPASRRFGGSGGVSGPPSVAITLSGRDKNGAQFSIPLVIERSVYQALKDGPNDPLEMRAKYIAGRSGGFGRGPGRSVAGSIVLDKAGMEPGEPVSGTLDLTVFEAKGGFFNRR